MLVIDDALMALIFRFVVDTGDDGLSDQEFLQRQLKTLRKHLAQFPKEERSARAIAWIGEHAARYRRDWEHTGLVTSTAHLRCADCPLAGIDAAEQCEIHEQWLFLLHRYLAGEAMTHDYVEDCLALLRDYKSQHARRLDVISAGGQGAKKSGEGKRKGKKRKKRKKANKGKRGNKEKAG